MTLRKSLAARYTRPFCFAPSNFTVRKNRDLFSSRPAFTVVRTFAHDEEFLNSRNDVLIFRSDQRNRETKTDSRYLAGCTTRQRYVARYVALRVYDHACELNTPARTTHSSSTVSAIRPKHSLYLPPPTGREQSILTHLLREFLRVSPFDRRGHDLVSSLHSAA